jgi:16S rRNA (uracil1498-N3)-methyltransferase
VDYFYTPPHLIAKNRLTIEGEEFVHLTHVMRKRVGETIRVADGAGTAYDVTIAQIAKRATPMGQAQCEITAVHQRLNEPESNIALGVGILKSASRFDFLIEKVTELGVNSIAPLVTERSIVRHAKTERWQKLALAAMKQSQRCVLPAIRETTSFEDFIASAPSDALLLIPNITASTPVQEALAHHSLRTCVCCIGPEGGFSDRELENARARGFIPVSLGARRLRTETAAVLAAGILTTHRSIPPAV